VRLYVSNSAIAAHADDIAAAGLKATITGVKFSPKKPISDELIAKLALASRNIWACKRGYVADLSTPAASTMAL